LRAELVTQQTRDSSRLQGEEQHTADTKKGRIKKGEVAGKTRDGPQQDRCSYVGAFCHVVEGVIDGGRVHMGTQNYVIQIRPLEKLLEEGIRIRNTIFLNHGGVRCEPVPPIAGYSVLPTTLDNE
jgi:hypothetical protein